MPLVLSQRGKPIPVKGVIVILLSQYKVQQKPVLKLFRENPQTNL